MIKVGFIVKIDNGYLLEYSTGDPPAVLNFARYFERSEEFPAALLDVEGKVLPDIERRRAVPPAKEQ